MSATHETKLVGSDGVEYVPATRADLKPGAVFELRQYWYIDRARRISFGTRLTLSEDDGSDCPFFTAVGKDRLVCIHLYRLSVAEPGEPAISQEAARQMLAALRTTQEIVADGAKHGFDPTNEEWANRLYLNQQRIQSAIAAAEGQS